MGKGIQINTRKFKSDLKIGNIGEDKLVVLLNDKNIKCQRGDGRKSDVILEDGRSIEVKMDVMSAKTSNIAVEFFNSRSQKPSGLTATTSYFFVFVLPCGQIWISTTENLKLFVENNPPLRIVFGAGDGNADLKLYKKDDILNRCFTRIDNLSELEMRNIIG